MPGVANVQLPLHFVPEAPGVVPTGTPPVHAGVAGPFTQRTPCGTLPSFFSATVPPAAMVAAAGDQAWLSW